MASDYTYKIHSCLQIFSALSGTVGNKPESNSLFNLKQELTENFYVYPCEKQALKPKVLSVSSDRFFGMSSQCPSCYVRAQLDKEYSLNVMFLVLSVQFSIRQLKNGVFAKFILFCPELLQISPDAGIFFKVKHISLQMKKCDIVHPKTL